MAGGLTSVETEQAGVNAPLCCWLHYGCCPAVFTGGQNHVCLAGHILKTAAGNCFGLIGRPETNSVFVSSVSALLPLFE